MTHSHSYFTFSYRPTIGGTTEHECGFHQKDLKVVLEHVKNALEKSDQTTMVVITRFVS